jgi:hypothetical protein
MRSSRRHRPFGRSSAAALLEAALSASETDPGGFEVAMGHLADQLDTALPLALALLDDRLDDLWRRGWTPTDLTHVIGRHLSAAHAQMMAAAIVDDTDRRIAADETLHRLWREQAGRLRDDLGSPPPDLRRLHLLVEALAVAARLPGLPVTTPPPNDPRSGLPQGAHLDERMLTRVRALLAKAESTDFDEEAEALTAKAQQLIARHAIDEVLLQRADDVGDPSARRVPLEDPYASAKAYLIAEVARANRCRVVHSPDLGWVTLFGYDNDLVAVELLATSLLAQAGAAMARKGSRRDAAGRSRTRSFRRAFLMGFGQRIGERLRQSADDEVAATADSDTRLLPVLAARRDRLVAAEQEAFPDIRRRSASVSNPTGWAMGRSAAEEANLDVAAARLPGR